MKTYTKEELDKILELHNKWVYGKVKGVRANLSHADLSYANLINANLSSADLYNANLSNANLTDADLSNADLSYANLSHANLINVDLYNANLFNANLTNVDLYNANLSDANLSHANLINANLSSANLYNASLFNVKDVISFTLTKHFGFAWKKDNDIIVKIGCEEYNLKYWLKNYKSIGRSNKYTPKEREFYRSILKVIKSNF